MTIDQPADNNSPDLSSVRVAVRIRPQSARERIEFCRVCTTVTPGEPQILLGNDRAFTFDFVFNSDSNQEQVFESCARPLIVSCLEGYNSTIFAYGQTGSGKTYSMGTGFEVDQRQGDIGIIPRSVELLFAMIRERRVAAVAAGIPVPEFQVSAQFLELYNEEVYDLFDADRDVYSKRGRSAVKIHESSKGEIFCENVTSRQVESLADTMECLRLGSLARATASTAMNAQSSRSHAIFTVYIKQQRAVVTASSSSVTTSTISSGTEGGSGESASNGSPSSQSDDMAVTTQNGSNNAVPEFEILTAKFHFVDLAGSERLKRTGATGERAREGISINSGLLSLGNVISALGDTARHCSHVPYRDSKLTRILQDSLGGNSCTVMVACISPSDCDFVETLNTLKYANRARNIRNKVTVNQDKTSAVISALRAEIIQLKQELLEFRQGKRLVDTDGADRQNDVDKENALLLRDNDLLRRRIHALQETIEGITETNARLIASVEATKASKVSVGDKAESDASATVPMDQDNENGESESMEAVILRYARDMERMKAQLTESQGLCRQLLQQRTGGPVARSAQNTPRTVNAALVNNINNNNGISAALSSSFSSPAMQPPVASSSATGTPMSAQNKHNSGIFSGDGTTLMDANGEFSNDDDALLDEAKSKLARLQQQLIMQSSGGSDVVNGNEKAALEGSMNDAESQDEEGQQNEAEITQLDCEITEIQKQINIQVQLIERLEQSQRQMALMKQQYEAKVSQLQNKIRETEAERDRVLNTIEKTESATKGKSDQLRLDYEAKIMTLQSELRKIHSAAREHARNQAKQAENERKLELLRNELLSMKQARTTLQRRCNEEKLKQRKAEAEKNREIAKLKRQQQQKDSVIQKLEAEKRKREIVSKRQQEEADALRRRIQMRRAVTAGHNRTQVAVNSTQSISSGGSNSTMTLGQPDVLFTTEECEEVWQIFFKRINHLVARKSLLNRSDCELKRLLSERETLNQRLQRYLRQRGHVNASPIARISGELIADVEAQIDALKANIRYNEDSIEECQRRIIQLVSPEDWLDQVSGDGTVTPGSISRDVLDGEFDMKQILTGSNCRAASIIRSPDALRFLVDKLMNSYVSQGISLSRLESNLNSKPVSASVPQIELSSKTSKNGYEGELVPTGDQGLISKTPTKDVPTITEDACHQTPKASGGTVGFLAVSTRSAKARRWSATTQELLFGRTPNRDGGPPSAVNATTIATNGDQNLATLVEGDSEHDNSKPVLDSSDALVEALTEADHEKARRKSIMQRQVSTGQRNESPSSFPGPTEAPASPMQAHRTLNASESSDTNVFTRLSRGSRRGSSHLAEYGGNEAPVASLSQMPGKIRASTSQLLNNSNTNVSFGTCVNSGRTSASNSPSPSFSSFDNSAPVVEYVAQASGHTRTVLCVTGDSQGILFTGSKDRTAKAWDLMENRELFTLSGHPDSVVRILYSSQNRLLFTVAGGCIRVWDCRCFAKPVAEIGDEIFQGGGCYCCQTLLSSGLSMEGAGSRSEMVRMSRSDAINDAALLSTPSTELLMSSLNADVRVWDLRNFTSMAKLIAPGSGMSAVMSMCSAPAPYRYVFTGSRDHLVRFYDLTSGVVSGSIAPRLTFEPPHCDNVQALAFNSSCSENGGRMVTFSGSRDGCLKKWEWDAETARFSSDVLVHVLSNAHRSGISSLAVIPWLVDSEYQDQLLVSTGRDGALRIWNASPEAPLAPLAEVATAHPQPITSVAGANTDNGVFVYTASQDRHVRIWRLTTKD